MHHLSCSPSNQNVNEVRIFIKRKWADFLTTKISYRKQFNKHYKRYYIDSSFTSMSNYKPCIILALINGRGKFKYEVGLAILDLCYPHLTLCQISDCFVYSNTIAKINVYEPVEIVMPESYLNENFTSISLYHRIARKFKKSHITFISSQHFSALVGWDFIEIYCTNETSLMKHILKYKKIRNKSVFLS